MYGVISQTNSTYKQKLKILTTIISFLSHYYLEVYYRICKFIITLTPIKAEKHRNNGSENTVLVDFSYQFSSLV
jgi:hypothetical protein